MTFEQKILDRIKTGRLKPLSKGYFKARDMALWGLIGAFIAALGVGVGMIIYAFNSTDLSVLAKLELSPSQKVLFSFPVFWILACIVAGTVAFINLRRTRKGYKVSARQFGLIAALVAVGVGSLVYALNVAQYLSGVASDKIPLYNTIVGPDTATWLDPERGLLSGVIRTRDSNASFYVRDADAVLWHVMGDDIILPEGYKMESGERIKLIGTKTGEDTFEAREAYPWIVQ